MSKSTQENSKFEQSLIGRKVQIRSHDWKQAITGTLEKVERYAYVLRLDTGGVLGILKHACSAIAVVKEEGK